MYNKKMSRSIDKPSGSAAGELLRATLLPVAVPSKTYKIPEGLLPLKPWQVVNVGGGHIRAKGGVDSLDVTVFLADNRLTNCQHPALESHLRKTVLGEGDGNEDGQGDIDFVRSLYYGAVARDMGLTVPDVISMTADSKRLLKSAGFSEVLATGSLANVGLVLSRGDELSDPADIERRARGIGLYTKETITFPGAGEDSKDNQFIALTDAAGNRIIMPYSGIRERILMGAFGYEEADGQEK